MLVLKWHAHSNVYIVIKSGHHNIFTIHSYDILVLVIDSDFVSGGQRKT